MSRPVEYDRLPPARRLSLYLTIARKMRALGPQAAGIRHEAVRQAWAARQQLQAEVRAEALEWVLRLIYDSEEEG